MSCVVLVGDVPRSRTGPHADYNVALDGVAEAVCSSDYYTIDKGYVLDQSGRLEHPRRSVLKLADSPVDVQPRGRCAVANKLRLVH